jgi:hypothetical protein
MPDKTDDQNQTPAEESPPPAEETSPPTPAVETPPPTPAEVVNVEVEEQTPPSFANWTQAEKDEVHEFIKQSRDEKQKRQTEERESAPREQPESKPKRGLRFKQRRK